MQRWANRRRNVSVALTSSGPMSDLLTVFSLISWVHHAGTCAHPGEKSCVPRRSSGNNTFTSLSLRWQFKSVVRLFSVSLAPLKKFWVTWYISEYQVSDKSWYIFIVFVNIAWWNRCSSTGWTLLNKTIFASGTITFFQIQPDSCLPTEVFNQLNHPCCTEFRHFLTMARC